MTDILVNNHFHFLFIKQNSLQNTFSAYLRALYALIELFQNNNKHIRNRNVVFCHMFYTVISKKLSVESNARLSNYKPKCC